MKRRAGFVLHEGHALMLCIFAAMARHDYGWPNAATFAKHCRLAFDYVGQQEVIDRMAERRAAKRDRNERA